MIRRKKKSQNKLKAHLGMSHSLSKRELVIVLFFYFEFQGVVRGGNKKEMLGEVIENCVCVNMYVCKGICSFA